MLPCIRLQRPGFQIADQTTLKAKLTLSTHLDGAEPLSQVPVGERLQMRSDLAQRCDADLPLGALFGARYRSEYRAWHDKDSADGDVGKNHAICHGRCALSSINLERAANINPVKSPHRSPLIAAPHLQHHLAVLVDDGVNSMENLFVAHSDGLHNLVRLVPRQVGSVH